MSEASQQVLTTLNADGTRQWMRPRLSHGRLLVRRAVVAYGLMGLFFVLPFIRIGGKPSILLDIPRRRFDIFGYTFLPTDTVLLALLLLTIFVTIFLFTAFFGRLWCGWICPQTVYMEFLYRPLERVFDGTIGRGGTPKNPRTPLRRVGYFLMSVVATLIPVHTFLAYFVGVENLRQWMVSSPFAHPVAFGVMLFTTVLMLFDFSFFREQLCILACPYGRFQSVLLDRWSLIVLYDGKRGEPRGKIDAGTRRRGDAASGAVALGGLPNGDCIDCRLCVQTCPTGIDIREGLQMECVNCTQCIDACDAVMEKIGRARGLIRYSSQAAMETGVRKLLRPRVVLYPLLLAILLSVLTYLLVTKSPADIFVAHAAGNPYVTMPNGEIANSFKMKIVNRTEEAASYSVSMVGTDKARVMIGDGRIEVLAGQSVQLPCMIVADGSVIPNGVAYLTLRVSDGKKFTKDVPVRVLGPGGSFGDDR